MVAAAADREAVDVRNVRAECEGATARRDPESGARRARGVGKGVAQNHDATSSLRGCGVGLCPTTTACTGCGGAQRSTPQAISHASACDAGGQSGTLYGVFVVPGSSVTDSTTTSASPAIAACGTAGPTTALAASAPCASCIDFSSRAATAAASGITSSPGTDRGVVEVQVTTLAATANQHGAKRRVPTLGAQSAASSDKHSCTQPGQREVRSIGHTAAAAAAASLMPCPTPAATTTATHNQIVHGGDAIRCVERVVASGGKGVEQTAVTARSDRADAHPRARSGFASVQAEHGVVAQGSAVPQDGAARQADGAAPRIERHRIGRWAGAEVGHLHIARHADACACRGDIARKVAGARADGDTAIGRDGGGHPGAVVHAHQEAVGRTRRGREGARCAGIAHQGDVSAAL